MAGIVFKMDMTPLIVAQARAMQEALDRLAGAVEYVAAKTAEEWKISVLHAKLWDQERQAYADSITWKMTGPYKAEVWTDYKNAEAIENGRPAYDLKRMLDSSTKVRTNKKGQRYLIIPFRHNTPGYTGHSSDMPDHVYAIAKKLAPSSVKGMTTRVSGTGAYDIGTGKPLTVPQAIYSWGGRMRAGSMGPNPKGKVDRFAGMVRFMDKAAKSGPKSTYMTFRVMKEGSPGWIIPARPGMNLAREVTMKMKPLAEKEFLAAIKGEVGQA